METGHLPTPRRGLQSAVVDNIIFVTGGEDRDMIDYSAMVSPPLTTPLTDILSWDPSTQSWRQAGNLAVGRFFHAAVAIPSSIVESECVLK